MRRPVGVAIIAVFLVLGGVLNVIQGISYMNSLSGLWGGIQLALGLAAVACGIGCWALKRWARATTIVLMALNAISIIIMWVQYSDRIIVSRVIIPLALNVIIILYLLTPKVSAAFKKA